MEFLEKHKELSTWKSNTAPFTILEEEEQTESDDTVTDANSEKTSVFDTAAVAVASSGSSWVSRRQATQERVSRAAESSDSAAGRSGIFQDGEKVQSEGFSRTSTYGVFKSASASKVVRGVPKIGGVPSPRGIESLPSEACLAKEECGAVETHGDRGSGETDSVGSRGTPTMRAEGVATTGSMSMD